MPDGAGGRGSGQGVNEDALREAGLAEAWFADHGLPWFVDGVDARVAALVAPSRLLPVLAVCAGLGSAVGWAVTAASDAGNGISVGLGVFLVLLVLYAGGPLRVGTMTRWAARRMVAELSLMVSLAVRALPMLLISTTFLFVNTEVWQVVGGLRLARVWAAVLVFTLMGAAFLLTRLPREVRRVEAVVVAEGLSEACQGTPLAARARLLADRGGVVPPDRALLSRAQRINLVLVLLAAQGFQVLMLATAVFAFFTGFGVLIMRDEVVELWVGAAPSYHLWDRVGFWVPVSGELAKVSGFLAGFAAMYFTIYAVSDAGYRREFFAEVDSELTRAVGVRAVYRAIVDETLDADPDSVGDQGH